MIVSLALVTNVEETTFFFIDVEFIGTIVHKYRRSTQRKCRWWDSRQDWKQRQRTQREGRNLVSCYPAKRYNTLDKRVFRQRT